MYPKHCWPDLFTPILVATYKVSWSIKPIKTLLISLISLLTFFIFYLCPLGFVADITSLSAIHLGIHLAIMYPNTGPVNGPLFSWFSLLCFLFWLHFPRFWLGFLFYFDTPASLCILGIFTLCFSFPALIVLTCVLLTLVCYKCCLLTSPCLLAQWCLCVVTWCFSILSYLKEQRSRREKARSRFLWDPFKYACSLL